MPRRRLGIAFVLAIAVGVLPLATDWCAASCDSAHMTEASTADPVCHPTSSAVPLLGQAPGPCGHDHSSSPTLLADRSVPSSLLQSIALTVVVPAGSFHAPALRAPSLEREFRPPPESIPRSLSVSLRI